MHAYAGIDAGIVSKQLIGLRRISAGEEKSDDAFMVMCILKDTEKESFGKISKNREVMYGFVDERVSDHFCKDC